MADDDTDPAALARKVRRLEAELQVSKAAKPAKASKNKELFNRQHFKPLADADIAEFIQQIDTWILEFAELYATKV